MSLEKLNESKERQNTTTPTTEKDPNVITITDRNGNTNLIKIEQIENTNQNTNNEPTTRKSSSIKTVNPIIRFGNPITHYYCLKHSKQVGPAERPVKQLERELSERASCPFVTVLSTLPSLLLEDILSVKAMTKFVISLICLFISENRWFTACRSVSVR